VPYTDMALRIIDVELFDEPPVAARHTELAAMEERLQKAKQSLTEIHRQIETLQTENKARLEKLACYQGLEHLEAFLDGKITHFVIDRYGPPKILPKDKALEVDDEWGRRQRDLKLLTLYGSTKGCLTWNLNQYRDGSGCETEVIPCTSYDQALEVWKERLAAHEVDARENPRRISSDWVKAAESLGLSVSDWYKEQLSAKQAEARATQITQLRKQLAELEATP